MGKIILDNICSSWIVGWCCELDDDNGSDGIGFDREDGTRFDMAGCSSAFDDGAVIRCSLVRYGWLFVGLRRWRGVPLLARRSSTMVR